MIILARNYIHPTLSGFSDDFIICGSFDERKLSSDQPQSLRKV